jgi:beta-glucosidase
MIGDYAYPCHIETLIEMKEKENTFNTPVPDDLGDISGAVEVVTLFESLKKKIPAETSILFAEGCGVNDTTASGMGEAVEIARQSDVVILAVGDKSGLTDDCTSGEARDSATLRLPGLQENLVNAVINTGTPVILVLICGRPYQLASFHSQVRAILFAGLPGEEGGNALADLLLGTSCPSGKLPLSYPRSVGQIPVFYSHKPSGGRSHWKGSYIDESEKALYPFGFGLSYTEFEFKNLTIDKPEIGFTESIEISCEISNKGERSGTEVVQLYSRYQPENINLTRPVKELKGFSRVALKPAETKRVTFTLFASQLAYYKENLSFFLAPGIVTVMIGSSSQDIHLKGEFKLMGDREQKLENRNFFSEVTLR